MHSVAVCIAFVVTCTSGSFVAAIRYMDPMSLQPGSNGDIGDKRMDLIEPSCDELRAMWRYTKRQSRAAKGNGYPIYHDPGLFKMWQKYSDRTKAGTIYRGESAVLARKPRRTAKRRADITFYLIKRKTENRQGKLWNWESTRVICKIFISAKPPLSFTTARVSLDSAASAWIWDAKRRVWDIFCDVDFMRGFNEYEIAGGSSIWHIKSPSNVEMHERAVNLRYDITSSKLSTLTKVSPFMPGMCIRLPGGWKRLHRRDASRKKRVHFIDFAYRVSAYVSPRAVDSKLHASCMQAAIASRKYTPRTCGSSASLYRCTHRHLR